MKPRRVRDNAYIKQQPHLSLGELFDRGEKECKPLWILLGFYRRLWQSIKLQHLHDESVPGLFGETFIWWYCVCFEDQLEHEDKIEAIRNIHKLKEWLDGNADPHDFERWNMRGLKAKEQLGNDGMI